MSRRFQNAFLISLFVVLFSGCLCPKQGNSVFQASTIAALSQGMYDGDVTFSELSRHGDFGLGTFNHLDGEMIELDHVFYQAKTDGYLYPVSLKKDITPFSVITFFHPDLQKSIASETSLPEIKKYILTLFVSKNMFYAIKIDGTFSYVKIRSVPAQSKPYPTLDEAVKNQSVFEFHDIRGTLVGFWFPEDMKNMAVPNYHFHFISRDKKRGGHLLDCTIKDAMLEISNKTEFNLRLPMTKYFREINTSSKSEGLAEK